MARGFDEHWDGDSKRSSPAKNLPQYGAPTPTPRLSAMPTVHVIPMVVPSGND